MEEKSMVKEMLVRKIKNYIELHRAEELSLDKIAAELNYSKFYMERVFAETAKMTIYKYIQACRLDAAAEQLAQTDRPIIDIALEAGYASPQAFTQAFRRMYLCPPRVYRQNRAFHPERTEMFMCRAKAAPIGVDRGRQCEWFHLQDHTAKAAPIGVVRGRGYIGRRKRQRGNRLIGASWGAASVQCLPMSFGQVDADAVCGYGEQSTDYLGASDFEESRWAA